MDYAPDQLVAGRCEWVELAWLCSLQVSLVESTAKCHAGNLTNGARKGGTRGHSVYVCVCTSATVHVGVWVSGTGDKAGRSIGEVWYWIICLIPRCE